MPIPWREILLIIIALLAVYAAVELVALVRLRWPRRWSRRAPERPQVESGAEPEFVVAAPLRAEIAELRRQVDQLRAELDAARQSSALTAPAGAASGPHQKAVHLAQSGASADEIAAACGISRGEAELIAALHQSR